MPHASDVSPSAYVFFFRRAYLDSLKKRRDTGHSVGSLHTYISTSSFDAVEIALQIIIRKPPKKHLEITPQGTI